MTRLILRSLKQACLILAVICIGTAFDWFAHQTSAEYSVPSFYFRNKIIFGTLIGLLALNVLRSFTKNDRWLAFGVTFLVALLLQTKYYLEGYSLDFVFLFMGIHFVAFFIPALILFRTFRRLL